jgi:Mrp family chromosome partitioning ATPase
MSLLKRGLQGLGVFGGAADPPAIPSDDCEKICLLEPLAKVTATMHAADGDTMRLAWDLRSNSALSSQLRGIRREIGKLLSGRRSSQRGTVIVMTSAMPGEGKSFLSVALARVFATGQDRKVVLVDGDLPKRHLTQLLGTSELPGLIECMADGRAISDVLCPTDHPAMTFVPAGKWRPDAPDLISSSKLDGILESFRQCDERHVFLIDTAPVLAFGETAYLAERADLVVLTIRAGKTPRAAADEALRKLAADRPLALVLNGQEGSVLDSYYGYGESYGDYSPSKNE